jgi:GT2 family glycosyltransferase
MRDVLIICTKDRPDQVRTRLSEFTRFEELPDQILVVDSSADSQTEQVVLNAVQNIATTLSYLWSSAGLPRQRNVGITWAKENIQGLQIIHFLDDDIIPNRDYFTKINDVFRRFPDAIAVGGFDSGLDPGQNGGILRRMFWLGSKQSGVILSSGIAIPPRPRSDVEHTEWLVGATQSFRASIFDHAMFNPKLRMYGEDIDFYLRIRGLGDILCSASLPVIHLNDPTNRESPRNVNLFHNGIRWLFSQEHPEKISKRKVLVVAFVLGFGELVKSVFTLNIKRLGASIGNFEFLVRIVLRKKVIQTIQ